MTFTAPPLNLAADTPTPEQFQADLLTIARSHDFQKFAVLLATLDRSSEADWVAAIAGVFFYLPDPEINWLTQASMLIQDEDGFKYGWWLITRAIALITGGMAA